MAATSVVMPNLLGILFVLLSSGGGGPLGLPVSMPPRPEDPMLAKVAPADCLWYLSLSGAAKPDAKSGNQTEQLFAEVELQNLLGELDTRLSAFLKAGAPKNPPAQKIATEVPPLVRALLTQPLALFASKVEPNGPRGPIIEGGAVVATGEQTAAIQKSLESLEATLLAQPAPADAAWHTIPTPPDAPKIEWGFRNAYLIVGVGAGSADAIVARAKGNVPDWLTDVKKRLAVKRVSTVHYLNVKRVIDTALSQAHDPEPKAAVQILGLDHLLYYASVTGLEGEGAVEKSLLASDGKPVNLLAAIAGKPLTTADLAPIPKNANLAIAARLDANKLFHDALDMLGKIDARARKDLERGLTQAEPLLGKMPDALFESLGDSWCAFNSPSEGGLLYSGVTLVVPVRDRVKLRHFNQQLLGLIRTASPAPRPDGTVSSGASVKETEFGSRQIHFINFTGEGVPIAPAWCITDTQLIVGLFPQSVKSYLARPAGSESLDKIPAVAKALAAERPPLAISYQDSENVFRTIYPILQSGVAMACGELQRQAVDVDISLLPSADSIARHLRPSVTAVSLGNDGLQVIGQTTLPVNVGVVSPMLLGSLFFVRSARSMGPGGMTLMSIGEAQSQNNLKQLALAAFNHESLNGAFPGAYSVNKDGKPLLSWRVHMLPFLEQKDLYDQFNLNEPWDSAHNKPLIGKMPQIFATPDGPPASSGKTCYVVPRGEQTIFPGDKGTPLRDIRDGTSNTVLLLEVDADQAVIWSKPDDWQFDDKKPLAGLGRLRGGHFLTAFADGSVRQLPLGLNPDSAKGMFTRDGGEVINLDDVGPVTRPLPPSAQKDTFVPVPNGATVPVPAPR